MTTKTTRLAHHNDDMPGRDGEREREQRVKRQHIGTWSCDNDVNGGCGLQQPFPLSRSSLSRCLLGTDITTNNIYIDGVWWQHFSLWVVVFGLLLRRVNMCMFASLIECSRAVPGDYMYNVAYTFNIVWMRRTQQVWWCDASSSGA